MSDMGIALQLYTIREAMASDFVGSLRKVAAIGYEGVEFAGFGGLAAEEVKTVLDELKLKAVGSHVSVYQLRDHLEEEVAYHKAIGAQYVVAPWISEEFRSAEAFPSLLAILDRAGKAFKEAGIGFGYHNHDFEFKVKVDGNYMLDELFARTSPSEVQVELDIGWVYYSREDAAAYVEKYAGRIPLVHLKDFRDEPDGSSLTVPLGQGNAPAIAVIEAAKRSGVKWLIVEQDQVQGDLFESVTASREWLKANYR